MTQNLRHIVRRLLDAVPDFREFMYVEELYDSSRRLASHQHRDVAELVEVGSSRAGLPVYALIIRGGDEKRVLAFGFPHPNEPVGSLALEYLSWRLASDRELLKTFNATWIIVKVADVFGAKLNEGWFKGVFDVRKYALNYYRPPPYKQVEWSFPVEYKDFRWDKPVEETRALMKLIDEWRPTHIYSLHNAGFTGTYYYVSRAPPDDVLKLFAEIPKELGVPIHRGEPEAPYMVKLAEAVFKMPGLRESYDWLEKHLGRSPAQLIKHGGSSYDYAQRVNPDVFELVCEVPYIYDDRLDVDIRIGIPRREILRMVNSREEALVNELYEKVQKLSENASPDNPFLEALTSFLENSKIHLEAEKKWIEEDPTLSESATVAQAFDAYIRVYFYRGLLYNGLLYRASDYEIRRGSGEPWTSTRDEALKAVDHYAETFNRLTNYRVIPISNLMKIQLNALVSTVLSM